MGEWFSLPMLFYFFLFLTPYWTSTQSQTMAQVSGNSIPWCVSYFFNELGHDLRSLHGVRGRCIPWCVSHFFIELVRDLRPSHGVRGTAIPWILPHSFDNLYSVLSWQNIKCSSWPQVKGAIVPYNYFSDCFTLYLRQRELQIPNWLLFLIYYGEGFGLPCLLVTLYRRNQPDPRHREHCGMSSHWLSATVQAGQALPFIASWVR
jgi:hypothetical protein